MGIYLPNMEMPKPGEVIRIYNNGEARRCHVTEQKAFEVGIAFPVPPHGNLIDLRSVNIEDGPYEYQDWVEWALEQYLNAPIFIPAEEGET